MPAARPRVTIVIPVYNGSRYLREAIDSALGQTYDNVEILVVNDGSTDGGRTEAIARSYEGRIRYLAKANGGVATALNLGIERSEGEYFSWLSHDDVYCPKKIEVQVDYVRRLGRDVIVYSDYETIDEASRTIAVHRLAHFSPAQFRGAVMRYGLISGCTLLVPMACFRASGLFSADLRTTNDYAKWFELSSRYEFHHLPEVLIRSRVHAEQDTQRLADLVRRECDALYAELIRALSIEDIRMLSEPVPVYYLEVANVFWRARYRASRRRAMWYALRSMSTLRRPEDVLRCARLMCVPLISQAKERVRRLLRAETRAR